MGGFVGILILCLFSALWAVLGASAVPAAPPWLTAAAAAPSVVIAALAIARPRPDGGLAWRDVQRRYLIVVAIEVAGIVAVSTLASNLGHPDLLVAGVALVVGLHFLPLARLFRLRVYVFTGLAMSAVALASLALAGPTRTMAVGFGSAAVLWVTCLITVLVPRRGVAA